MCHRARVRAQTCSVVNKISSKVLYIYLFIYFFLLFFFSSCGHNSPLLLLTGVGDNPIMMFLCAMPSVILDAVYIIFIVLFLLLLFISFLQIFHLLLMKNGF